VHDLEIVETFFISPLRLAKPPVIPSEDIDQFIDDVFLNILELRECNRRLLETLYVRQREQAPVIQRIGDILLEAATEFRVSYARYVGRHPIADKRLKDELERSPEFRLFIEVSHNRVCTLGDLM
jgi:RHO1 GDP-GTP exchange protein 1/2